MKQCKRLLCAFLSSFLLLSCPVHAHASAVALATPIVYSITYILAVCGVLVSSAMVGVLVGNWSSKAEYLKLGAEKKLGAYAQRVYENARSLDSQISEKFQAIEETLISCGSAAWGEAVTGIRPLAADMKEFLKEAFGYSIEGVWQIPTVPEDHTWGVSEWSAREAYPVPVGPLYPSYPTDPAYRYFLTSYVQSSYGSDCMNIQNWYYVNSLDLFGVYDVSTRVLTTYQRKASTSEYALYYAAAYSVFVNSDGSLRYTPGIQSGWTRATMRCSPADAGSLSFPVFSSLADAQNYVATGDTTGTYVSGTVPLEVDSFREDVAGLKEEAVSDVLTLPVDGDTADSHLADLTDIYTSGAIEEVGEVLGAGGLALEGVTDIPVTGDTSLSDILNSIRAIPGSIADVLADTLSLDASDAQDQLSVPGIISEKFPFCIPFDVIYLIQSLAAEREVPRFVIPIDFDYQFIQYHHEFIVDFTDWDSGVTVFRVMLDLLFCACLISATRSLIRG